MAILTESSKNKLSSATVGLTFLLAALTSIGPFTIDTYLPSFLDIADKLKTTTEIVQQTITAYLLGFGLMSLWHGAISDAFGRRKVILIGMVVYMLTAIGCMLAGSIEQLIFFRIVQGLSAGSGIVIARAVVRDLFDGAVAQKLMSYMSMLFAIAPAIAPIIGGLLQVHFGWRAQFGFLTILSLMLIIATYLYLPETLPPEKRQSFNYKNLLAGYSQIFASQRFWLLALSITFLFGGFFMFVLSSPKILITVLGLREDQFYILFIPFTLGMMLGSWISGLVAHKWRQQKTIKVAFVLMISSSILNVLFHLIYPPQLPWTIIFLPLYTIGMAMAMPSLSLIIFDEFPQRRGMISSCQSFIQVFGSSFFAGLVAPLIWHKVINLSVAMLILSVLSLFCLIFLKYNEKSKN